jgi:hypothetical protein
MKGNLNDILKEVISQECIFSFTKQYLQQLNFLDDNNFIYYINFLLDDYNYLKKQSSLNNQQSKLKAIKDTINLIDHDYNLIN